MRCPFCNVDMIPKSDTHIFINTTSELQKIKGVLTIGKIVQCPKCKNIEVE